MKFKTMDDLKHFLDQTTCLEDRLQAKAILLSTEIDKLRDVIASLREVSRSIESVNPQQHRNQIQRGGLQ